MGDKKSLTILLGKAIRERRKSQGLTQDELAEKIGIGNQALSRIEHGMIAPKLERLPKIARVLGCEVSDLFRSGDAGGNRNIDELISLLESYDSDYLDKVIPILISLIRAMSNR